MVLTPAARIVRKDKISLSWLKYQISSQFGLKLINLTSQWHNETMCSSVIIRVYMLGVLVILCVVAGKHSKLLTGDSLLITNDDLLRFIVKISLYHNNTN